MGTNQRVGNEVADIACENRGFFLFLAGGDVSRGGKSATKQQKFHTDDVNQCLHNKSSSHGVPNANLFNLHNFSWSILVNNIIVFICK